MNGAPSNGHDTASARWRDQCRVSHSRCFVLLHTSRCLRIEALSFRNELLPEELPADVFLGEPITGVEHPARRFGAVPQPIAERRRMGLAFSESVLWGSECQQLTIAPEMRLDRGQTGSAGAVGRGLRDEEALGIEIAEVEDTARAAEGVEDFAQGGGAVHETVAAV